MLYIHQKTCISPQQTFINIDIEKVYEPVENKLHVIEPSYEGIPSGILRRMGKALRIGVGAALPLIRATPTALNGIIIGTANGGMEDCIKFLDQIIEYEEGNLTPTNFVQSTPNAIASQLGLISTNKGYNITHVHRGLAFENALIDTSMLLRENPLHNYLVGGVDEISTYNYNIEYLSGWYKKEPQSGKDLYNSVSEASIAGEGSAMFTVNKSPKNADAYLRSVHIFQSKDEKVVGAQLRLFLKKNLDEGENIDLLLSGENGDIRILKYYESCETILGSSVNIARFKHMCGEYPTASAVAVWLACHILQQNPLPAHMIKRVAGNSPVRRILIINNHAGVQHSFILVDKLSNNKK